MATNTLLQFRKRRKGDNFITHTHQCFQTSLWYILTNENFFDTNHLKKRVKPVRKCTGWISIYNKLSSCNLVGTKTTWAYAYCLGRAIYNCLYLSDIGLPYSVCFTVGVRNIKAESHTLAAEFTFSHSDAPPVLW